jgi:hypothetical protein
MLAPWVNMNWLTAATMPGLSGQVMSSLAVVRRGGAEAVFIRKNYRKGGGKSTEGVRGCVAPEMP